MRRFLVLAVGTAVLVVSFGVDSRPVAAQKHQRVELPDGTVLALGSRPVVTRDGSIGLVAPAVGDTLDAFAVQNGDVVGRLEGLGNATALALHEDGPRRLAVLTFAGGSSGSAVVVVDATDPAAMAATSIFRLAEGLELAPNARAELAHGQKYGVVAIAKPVAALVSFDVESGEQVGALTLDGDPESVTLVDRGTTTVVAVSSTSTSKVALVSLSEAGVLLPESTFVAPDDAPLSSANNVAFDAAGTIGYVASLRGHALLSFSVETGELVDRLETQGSSAGVTVYHAVEGELIAVTNVSRPGGVSEDDVVPKADETPLGLPGAVVATSDAGGKLAERSRFYPDTGEELAPANNAEFSADGATVFVPARTGSLYSVDVATGKSIAREGLENRIQSIAAAPLAESVAVLSAGGSEGHIDLVPAPKPEAPAPDVVPPSTETTAENAKRESEKTELTPPSISRLGPAVVQSGRRRDLPVTVVGSGIAPGAVVVVGSTLYSAAVGPNGKRANFTLSSSLLAAPGLVPVQVRNPDGSVSNVVNLEVVVPFAPIITRVRPKKILSGNDGVDVTIVGDHYRDGAVAKVTYKDRDGTPKTEELKSYRLSFTTLIARMPSRLVRRAAAYQLTVTDRDGVTVSEPQLLSVFGPTISSITPERLVAGEVGGDEALVLHISGENFHQDAAVYVKRPLRNPDDGTAPLVAVPSGNVKWKSGERLVVRLSGSDVAYSGNLIVRVVNPVPGEKRKNGDVAEWLVAIAGPMIASTAPDVVIAGSESFFFKITGTDFRRAAIVKFTRDGGGQGQRRAVVVDDPNFKDRKQINVEMNQPELLRLVARPGTLHVRVVNPNGANGAPSPSFVVQVVAPSITAAPELIPSVDDPSVYRLKITGQYFSDGAVVQIYDSNGSPVGQPLEARYKSGEELVAIIGRNRVTELRTFKVVVVNPGGPYNGSGVPSNPFDVTAN